jgi:hypothetical protein
MSDLIPRKFGVKYFQWRIFWKVIFHPILVTSALIEQELVIEGTTICDACGKPITEDQENVGFECDLHEACREVTP